VRRELPYYYEGDERVLVQIAVRMAVSEDPNPRWFGNPGSTVIYPLAFLYRLTDVFAGKAPLVGPDRALLERFRADPGPFYLAGRVMNVAYVLGSLGLLFLVGRKTLGEPAALGGLLLAVLCPLPMAHAQLVRTDAAGLFFGMLTLWACLRLRDAPTARRHVAAGAALGLAVASRYFFGALLLPYAAASLLGEGGRPGRREIARMLIGCAAAAVAFLAVTPFFLLDFETALSSLRGEARATHPGADGLTPAGNFWFYATDVIPGQLGAPLALLAGIGVAAALVRRSAGPRLLALFVVGLLLGICLSALHWPRWTLPALPLLALFAAATLERAVAALLTRFGRQTLAAPAYAIALVALAAPGAARWSREVLRAARPTTRLLARAWLSERLASAAKLVAERGSAPLSSRQQALDERLDFEPRGLLERTALGAKSIEVLLVPSLPTRGPLDEYLSEGYDYAITARYASVTPTEKEAGVYRELASRSRELARFEPEATRAGPLVQVWQLR
jgi:hypothetical protein